MKSSANGSNDAQQDKRATDKPASKDAHAPSDTQQGKRDAKEKARHSESENALPSSQDKNPVPPGSTRES
ncbi:hypothetical protein P3T18_004073 [Paraburkholderia sp. GAS199]|uniref:hypothetical protein n=1 Tax=Paraburkholderia sp. GAS199 TaxID=3035126 RepID=UPI003D1EBAA8